MPRARGNGDDGGGLKVYDETLSIRDHLDPDKHWIGEALPIPTQSEIAATVGLLSTPGDSPIAARADHQHRLDARLIPVGLGLVSWTDPFNSGVAVAGGSFTRANYFQIGRLVSCELDFVGLGAFITGDVLVRLPVTSAGVRTTIGGNAMFFDDSTGIWHQGVIMYSSVNQIAIRRWRQSGVDDLTTQSLSASIPFPWGTNDRIILSTFYHAA